MFVYWAIFTVLALGALLNQNTGPQKSAIGVVALASLPILAMIAFRWEVGPDWSAYVEIFRFTRNYSLSHALSHSDPAFFVLNWLAHQLSGPFWLVNLIYGVIFVGGLTAFALRQPNPWLVFVLAFPYLVIVVAMSGARQAAAIGFFFFALNAFASGRIFRFVVLAIIAALFHASALLMLPICALSYSKSRAQSALLVVIAIVLGWAYFSEAFGVYTERYSSERVQSFGVGYRLAMNALPALIFLSFPRSFGVEEHQRLLWRNLSLISLAAIALVFVLPSSTALDRFILYIFPLQFFVLGRVPYVFAKDRGTSGLLILLCIGYAALIQIVFLSFGTFAKAYVPYQSIFDI
jgi:hypothetical protein